MLHKISPIVEILKLHHSGLGYYYLISLHVICSWWYELLTQKEDTIPGSIRRGAYPVHSPEYMWLNFNCVLELLSLLIVRRLAWIIFFFYNCSLSLSISLQLSDCKYSISTNYINSCSNIVYLFMKTTNNLPYISLYISFLLIERSSPFL